MRTDLGREHAVLRSPVVVNPDQVSGDGKRQISITLVAWGTSRRHLARAAHPRLHPPAVIGAGLVNPGLRIKLVDPNFLWDRERRAPLSKLAPPTVVFQAVELSGPEVALAYSLRGKAKPQLRPPAILASNLPTQTTFAPQRRGQPKSNLRPPQVVLAVQEIRGPAVTNTYSSRGRPLYFLIPPAVIGAGLVNPGLRIKLTVPSEGERRRQDVLYKLSPPTVTATGEIFFGPQISLSYSSRRRGRYFLLPPAVLATNEPTKTTFAIQIRRQTRSVLFAPHVIFLAVEIYGPEVTLAPPRRPLTKSALRPPAVVSPVLFSGPTTQFAPSFRGVPKSRLFAPAVAAAAPAYQQVIPPVLTYSVRRRGSARLQPPAVVAPVVSYGPAVELAPAFRGLPKSRLLPPAVVAQPPAYQQVIPPTLTYSRRGAPKSFLKPPTVVFPFFARALDVTFAPQRRGLAKSRLLPPRVGLEAVEISGPEVSLTHFQPPKTHPKLSPPAVVGAGIVFPRVRVLLVFGKRGAPKSRLSPPAVVAQFELSLGPSTTLIYSNRGKAKSKLTPPTVVTTPSAVEIYGPQITRVRIKPQRTAASLGHPAVIEQAEGPHGGVLVSLAASRRPIVKSFLRLPTVVTPFALPYGLQVTLAPSRLPIAKSRLLPPVVVFIAVEIFGPETQLVRIRPPDTIARLFPPADITEAGEFPVVRIRLTYSRRGLPKSRLLPPVVVGQVVFFGPQVSLAPAFRGQPKSRLLPPVVVDQPPAFLPAEIISLAASFRGLPSSRLSPPAVVGAGRAFAGLRRYLIARQRRLLYRRTKSILGPPLVVVEEVFYGPSVELVPSRRGEPTSFLRPPAILSSSEPPRITLAPSRRGQSKSFLKPPTVVRTAVEILGPEVSLAPSKRGRPGSLLKPPSVVGRAGFRGLLLHLTYSRRGAPLSFLHPPAVAAERVYFGPETELAASFRGRPKSLPKPPTVVEAAEAFYGPQVTLTRIRPPRVLHALKVTLVALRRPQGDVCGFDIASSFVCYLEAPGTKDSGSVSAGSKVTGVSQAGSKIIGSESAGGKASGTDRKAT